MIELDGSHGEGGGQILRTSLALSLITGKPFHLRNIRAGRTNPGLQPQHLMSVQAAAAIGQARLLGASRGSSELTFEPGPVAAGTYHFPIGTAGATSLVLHTIYLPLALAAEPSEVTIEGGTHVKASPCFHFLDTTWRRWMQLVDVKVGLHMRRPGFYPRGGGLLQAHIAPCARLKAFAELQPAAAAEVTGFSAVAGLPEHIARRQAEHAAQRLKKELRLPVEVTQESWPGGPGSVLALILDTAPVPTLFFALGERGKPAERVADEAVAQVVRFQHAKQPGVDEHSADQLLLPLCLAQGTSTFPVAQVSSHLLTNAAVIRRFVDCDLTIEGCEGGPGIVKCTGSGLSR